MMRLLILIVSTLSLIGCRLQTPAVSSKSHSIKTPCFNTVTFDSINGLILHGKNMDSLYNSMQLEYIFSFSSLLDDSLGFSVFGTSVQFYDDTSWHLDISSIDSIIVHRNLLNTLNLTKNDTISRLDHVLLSKNTRNKVFYLLNNDAFKEYAVGLAINTKRERIVNVDENVFVKTVVYCILRSNAFLDCQKGNMDQDLIYYKRLKRSSPSKKHT